MSLLQRSSRPIQAALFRRFCTESVFKKRETALEAEYFNKLNAELAAKLRASKQQSEELEKQAHCAHLKIIFNKHKLKLTPEIESDLVNWKKTEI